MVQLRGEYLACTRTGKIGKCTVITRRGKGVFGDKPSQYQQGKNLLIEFGFLAVQLIKFFVNTSVQHSLLVRSKVEFEMNIRLQELTLHHQIDLDGNLLLVFVAFFLAYAGELILNQIQHRRIHCVHRSDINVGFIGRSKPREAAPFLDGELSLDKVPEGKLVRPSEDIIASRQGEFSARVNRKAQSRFA